MYSFPIGAMIESFKLPFEQAVEKAASLGVKGLQMYMTKGEMSPENLTKAKLTLVVLSLRHGYAVTPPFAQGRL